MGTLSDFRRQYPQYDDMSDVELADALHKKYYSDLPKEDVFKRLAVKPAAAPAAAPAVPAATPAPAASPTAEARLQARKSLKPVEAPGIFDYFTNREAAIKQRRERAAYMQELGQRGALEDIQTQTGFFDRLGDMFSRGLLSTTSSIKDTQRAIETDPVLKKQFTEEARRFAADKGVGIKGETTEEDVKKNFLRNVVPYVLEKGAESIPGMLAAAVPIPGLGLAQNFGSQARTAAELEGRQDVEALDLAKAAPGALAVSALDQIGLGGILATPAKTALGRIGKAALLEGGTEAIQSAIEYANPRIVTGSAIDAGEMFEQAAFGALVGGSIGGGARGVGEAVSAPFRSKADQTKVDPAAVTSEFQRLAAEEVASVMAANPTMKQNDAVKFVEDNAEALFNRATANIVSGTIGGAGVPTATSAGVDVGGGSGAGATTNIGAAPPVPGVADVGETVGGGLEQPVSSVPVPDVGTDAGVDTLVEPTAKQVQAAVPIIEQAFAASALDFVEPYGSVLNKKNELNSQQKTLAARIIVQSPEVDPYDAIGSVLDRGLETLTGKPVPKQAPPTSRTTVTGPSNAQELQDKLIANIADITAKADEQKAAIVAAPMVDITPIMQAPTLAERTIIAKQIVSDVVKATPELQALPKGKYARAVTQMAKSAARNEQFDPVDVLYKVAEIERPTPAAPAAPPPVTSGLTAEQKAAIATMPTLDSLPSSTQAAAPTPTAGPIPTLAQASAREVGITPTPTPTVAETATVEKTAGLPQIAHSLQPGDVVRTDMGDTFTVSNNTPLGERGDRLLIGTWDNGKESVVRASEFDTGFIPQPYVDANTGERKMGEAWTVEKVTPPAQKTLNDLAGLGAVNPENTNEVLVEGGGIQLTPVGEDIVQLDSLRAVEAGGGRKAMQQLIKAADENATTIQLSPEPFAAPAGKQMSPVELTEWYKGFGFQAQPDGNMVRPSTRAPSTAPEPEYTPQQIAENLDRFAMSEAQDRGLDPGMFREGVVDVQRGREPLTDQQILNVQGQEALDAYKQGMQWAQERVADAQAVPAATVDAKRLKQVINRKPGKTVAEKIFNMAQAEVDAMPKEDIVEQMTPYDPEYESIRAKPGMNATRMARMLGPQLYGDPTNMGQVCIKEVLQNSFDATRSAVDNGQVEQGKIEISVSKDYRTLTVKDNGIGMSPELLGGKFLEIAGTDKEGDKNAGGFGIAKMLFLYANKNIRVVTARDGRIAELNVTGEQLFESLDNPNAAPDINIREFEPVDAEAFPDGHGTIIQLTIPEKSGDYEIKKLPGWLDGIPSLERSPLFANIDVTFTNENYIYSPDTVATGANFPIQDYTQFVGVKFPWGMAKVYVTKEQNNQTYGQNMYILSNGLWQFSTKVNKNPSDAWSESVPYTFYVDIVPSVKPDQPGYPFNFNRQGFTDDASKDFGKVKSYIDALYAYKSRSGDATTFGLIQYFDENGQLTAPIDLTPDIPVVDTAFTRIAEGDDITVGADGSLLVNGQPMPELTPEELKAGIPSASDLKVDPALIDTDAVMLHDNADVTIKSTGEKMSIPDFMRRQFGERFDSFMLLNGQTFLKLRDEVARVMGYSSLYNEAIGVSLDPEYRGVSIRLPFSGSFINPLVPQYADGLRAGYGIFGTMIHELAHHKVRSHNASFPAEMQNILLNMEADTGFAYQQFKDNFADTVAADYADIVKLGVELFNGQNSDISIQYRGNKFTDGSGEQVSEGTGDSGTGDVREPSREGSTGESLLGPAYERRGRAGKRGDLGAGEGGGTQPLTDANVEKAVSVKLTKAQIKRLEAAAGIRSADISKLQKRIVQSRNDNETKGLIKRLAEAVQDPDANSGIIASLTRSMPPPVYKFILGFQQIEDIFRLAKLAGLKSLGKIDTIMREEYIPYVNRIVRRASTVEQEWTAFAARDPKGNAILDDTIMYSNMLDADPSLAATAAEYMRIDPRLKDLQDRLATEIDANKRRSLKGQITTRKEDIKRLYFGGELVDADGKTVEAVAGWNSLSPEGRKIFKAARDFHRANFNEHYRLLMQRIDDAKFDSNDAVKLKSSIEEMFSKARERMIYFPVKRFGEYWLSVGKDFYMRESAAELKALERRLKREGETREMTLGYSRDTLRNKVANNDASAALKGILDALDGGNTTKANGQPKIEEGDVKGLRDLIFQMYLTALPEADMRRRFVHRQFVTGFSTDSLRTFAATAVASANQLGRLAYNYKFQNVIEEAKKETEKNDMKPWLDTLTLEVEDRIANIMSPDMNNLLDAMIAFGSKLTFYHHLSSAASAMINLTQLHTLGLPVLSGKFGEAKTAAMAARYTTSFLTGREIPNPFRDENGDVKLKAPEFKFQNSAYMRSLKKNNPERYKQTMAAWEYAQDHDIIESTFASSAQLYERSNTPTGEFNFRQAAMRGEVLTATKRAATNAMDAMGFMFHSTETIGRGVMYMSTFDLAYEQAISQGKTPEQAGMAGRKLAAELTNKAMFDFTNWNKSRFAKAPVGRLALQMTSYIHSLSSLLLRSFVGMMPYFNKEGKAAAARVFFGSAGVTMLYGGLRSTQFYALGMGAYTLAKYAESLLEDDDEEEEVKQGYLNEKTIERELLKFADENENELGKKDMEQYVRATFIPQTFGKGSTLANALGLSDGAAANLATAADMGIPGLFDVDISGSVTMGDLPFIWSKVDAKGDTPEVRAFEATARMALGPFGSVGVSYVKAADAWNKGDIQQAMELMVPAIIRNPLKAQRLEDEGLKIGKDKDIQLKDPSYYTSGKVALQSLGFKDAETSRNMQLDLLAADVEKEVGAQKTELLDRRYRAFNAFLSKPAAEAERGWAEINRDIDIFNLNYPSSEITTETKERSLQNKKADAADKAYGLGINKKIPIRETTKEERIEQLIRDSGQ